MPRPKVWGDFTVNDAFEGTDDAGDDLVEFTCPYNCGKPIRMKERNVIKNKCPASLVLDGEGLAGEPWEGSGARLGLWAWALREGREREGEGRGTTAWM